MILKNQQLLDAMSDDDSSLSGDSDVESSDSDTIFSDFEDHFVQFQLYKLCYCYQIGKYIFLNKEAGRLSWTKICNNFYRQQTMAEQGHTRSLSSKQDQMKVQSNKVEVSMVKDYYGSGLKILSNVIYICLGVILGPTNPAMTIRSRER